MVLVVFHMVYEVRYPYPNLLPQIGNKAGLDQA